MKKIFSFIAIAAMATLAFTSCETYNVDDPDMTAISNVDGEYVCFGVNQDDPADSTVFYIAITNTTDNSNSAAWVTLTNLDTDITEGDYYCLSSIRFKASVDNLSLSINDNSAENPKTCPNPYLRSDGSSGGGYYSYEYYYDCMQTYTVTGSGKVTLNVPTATGYTTSGLEMVVSATAADGTVKKWNISGIKQTGWSGDVQEYQSFINEKGWW